MKVKKSKAKSDFPKSHTRKIVRVDDEIEVVVRELPNGLDGIDSLTSSLKLIDRYDPNWLDRSTPFILAGNKECFKKKGNPNTDNSFKNTLKKSLKNNSRAHDEICAFEIGHLENSCSQHFHKSLSKTQSESKLFEGNLYFNLKEIKNNKNTFSKNKMNLNNATHLCDPSLSSSMNVSYDVLSKNFDLNNQSSIEKLSKQKSLEPIHNTDSLSSSTSNFFCSNASDVESSLPLQKSISPDNFNYWDTANQVNFSNATSSAEQEAVSSKLHWMRFDQRSENFFTGGNELLGQDEGSCRIVPLQDAQQLPCPSEAETAPNTPGNDMFLDGVFSKIQHNFEQKNPLHCWLSSEKFETLSVQSLRESIQSKIAKTVITENLDDLESVSHNDYGNIKTDIFNQISAVKDTVSDTSKRKSKRKDELALLYDALKEISWAQNLSPKNLFAKYKSRRKHSNKLTCNFSHNQTKKLSTVSFSDSTQNHILSGKNELLNKKLRNHSSGKRLPEVKRKTSECQVHQHVQSTRGNSAQRKKKMCAENQRLLQRTDRNSFPVTGRVMKCMKKQIFPTTNILKKYMKRNIKSVENKLELLNVISSASHMKNGTQHNAYKTLSIHECHKNAKFLKRKLSRAKSFQCRKGTDPDMGCHLGTDHCYSHCHLKSKNSYYHQNGQENNERNSDYSTINHIPQQDIGNWNIPELSEESSQKSPELRVTLEPLEYTDLWFRGDSSDSSRCIKTRHDLSHQQKMLCQSSLESSSLKNFTSQKTPFTSLDRKKDSDFCHDVSLFSNVDQNHVASVLREVQGSIMDAFSSIKPSKKRRYEEETLRFSVRQSECAFRYKEIVVKKHQNYIQVVLVPNSGKQNSLTVEALKELREALHSARKDPNCRVLLVNSSGSFFCSGLDLCPLLGSSRRHAAEEIAVALKDLMQSLGTFPKPVVAAVNGVTMGLGVALLTLCDVVLASDKATFCIPSTKLGYIPEGAATLTLPQVVGATVATKMLLQGSKLTAQQALRYGLVSEVIWPTQLMEEVVPRVQALASQPLQVMEATKTMVRCHLWEKLQMTLEREARILPKQWMSPTCQKALQIALQNGCLSDF